MWIEAGHGMDLAQRHIDPGGQPPQLVRGQVAEFVLDVPEFVEHAASIPLTLHHNVAPSPAIVTAKVLFRDARSTHRCAFPVVFPDVPHCQLISRDGMGISRPNRYFLNYCSISFDHEARNTYSRRSRPRMSPGAYHWD